jgi:hypothetical protein
MLFFGSYTKNVTYLPFRHTGIQPTGSCLEDGTNTEPHRVGHSITTPSPMPGIGSGPCKHVKSTIGVQFL